MMQRRTLRIITWILLFTVSTIVVEGYDVVSGANIMKTMLAPVSSGLF